MAMLRRANLSIKRVVWVSFIVDLSDIVLNLLVALFSGSVVMLSQALQGIADLTTSGLLIIGVNQSAKRADNQFQFGYGRDLFFWVLASAVSMFVVTGGFSFFLGLNRYLHPQAVSNIPASLVVLAIGLLTNLYAFSLSFRRLFAGRQTRLSRLLSSSMVETKTTLFLDALGSIASLLGLVSLILLQLTNNNQLDGIGAMLTGLATASLAIFIIHDARGLIVGRGATPEQMKTIREAALGIHGVRAIEDLRTMHIGSAKLLVNIEVNLEPKLHTREIEKIMDLIKASIKAAVPHVSHVQVELEAARKKRH